MGTVYEALKRANAGKDGEPKKTFDEQQRRTGGVVSNVTNIATKNAPEHPWDYPSRFVSHAAHNPASTAHTEERAGSALSGGTASREAGATLDAAGSARVPVEFVSQDISPARVEPHLVAVTQPRSPYCEHFRSLRTRVMQAHERQKMQAFVITSAGVGEGKTLTTLNLAWLLAQADGVRALIIDSDLRHPCATEYLGIEATAGLSEVLAGETTLEKAIIRLEPAGLYLLPGGTARDDVAELLSGPKFSRVLSEVRKMFNYILIDAPPLGIFTDATLLINRADGALLVVRSGKTRYGNLQRLLDNLPRERMLGVVLNDSNEHLVESDYYYQKRYQRPSEVFRSSQPALIEDEEEEFVS